MTKERKLKFYFDSADDDDNNDDNNNEENHNPQHSPSPPSTSSTPETSDSGFDTLPKNSSSTFSPPAAISTSSSTEAAEAAPETRNGRAASIEDPNPGDDDSDTSTWVSRNRRNRRRPIGSDVSYRSGSGSFSEGAEPPLSPTSNSQDVVVEINSVDERADNSGRSREDIPPRPPKPARRISLERNLELRIEPIPRQRKLSQENNQEPHLSPDRVSPRPRHFSAQSNDNVNGGNNEVFLDSAPPHIRRTSGGILKNSPERESVELQDFNQPSKVRKYSREFLGGTPVETIQEDITEADTNSPPPSSYRNRNPSIEQLPSVVVTSIEDPDSEEIIEGPGLVLSDEEFQENYLGNIPAHKRNLYGVFPAQYRRSSSSPTNSITGPHPPTAAARRYRRSVSETGSKRISFDLTNQGLPSDPPIDNDDSNDSIDNIQSKPNGLGSAQSFPDLRLHERYKRARRFSHTSIDTLASKASSTGSDQSLSRTVAAHVRRDSIALFSDKVSSNSLKRTSQKLVADLEQLRKAHVGIFFRTGISPVSHPRNLVFGMN